MLDAAELGRAARRAPVPVPVRAVRAAADLTWRARLQPTPPGWLDMGLGVPLMDTGRDPRELGWAPRTPPTTRCSSCSAGMRDGAGDADAAARHRDTGGPLRVRELLTGVGRRGLVDRARAAARSALRERLGVPLA